MFLKPPELKSSRPAIAAGDEDLGLMIEKVAEEEEKRANDEMLPDK